ncbi:MAG: methionyl-tRNA formyltransferase [Rhodocyclaceae bacterium]|nr:methionyl-tRNA formyltransferase [Rhodocyclaceae bacterium]
MATRSLRVGFAGTPEFAAVALEAIVAAGFPVPLVLTQPDRPAGRGMRLQPSAVKQAALAHGLPVDQPERLRSEAQRVALAAAAPDVLVVAAYGLILPQVVLDLPRFGCINIHASLLPRWRGAAPIHRAIEAGDRETGITLMQMDAGLDTGPMIERRALPIDAADTTASLHDKLAVLGGAMVVEVLSRLAEGPLAATPQPESGVTYAHKISREEAEIDWQASAETIERRLRAFVPFPGLQSTLHGEAVKFWGGTLSEGRGEPGTVLAVDGDGVVVACGTGPIRFTVLQKAGGRRLPAADFLRGFPVAVGDRFSPPGN